MPNLGQQFGVMTGLPVTPLDDEIIYAPHDVDPVEVMRLVHSEAYKAISVAPEDPESFAREAAKLTPEQIDAIHNYINFRPQLDIFSKFKAPDLIPEFFWHQITRMKLFIDAHKQVLGVGGEFVTFGDSIETPLRTLVTHNDAGTSLHMPIDNSGLRGFAGLDATKGFYRGIVDINDYPVLLNSMFQFSQGHIIAFNERLLHAAFENKTGRHELRLGYFNG